MRSEEKAAKLRSLGFKTAIGSYQDVDKLEDLASETDIIFSIVLITSPDRCAVLIFSSTRLIVMMPLPCKRSFGG